LPLQLFSRLAITRAPAGLVTITNQKTGPFSRAFFQNVRNFPDVILTSEVSNYSQKIEMAQSGA